ncbi:MAG: hypothetical protein MUE46_10440 [Xanthomonadales bacterium]|jgi:glycosyltransferase involved in cell wall biosynthesis|nr:hypothetical protein [Xanthomonadales bacterium]
MSVAGDRKTPIVLVEAEAGGHHFVPYLLFLAQMLQARGHPLTLITTPAAAVHPAMHRLQQDLPQPLRWHPMRRPIEQGAGTLGLLRRQLDYWRAVREAARELPDPDAVFVLMSADALDRIIALCGSPFGGRRFVALFIQTKFHWAAQGIGPAGRWARLSRLAFLRVLAHPRLLAAASIDATLLESMRDHPAASRLHFVPDPGEIHCDCDRDTARGSLGLPRAAYVVLVYGVIDERKGVPALLQAALGMDAPLHLVLAGRFATGYREHLAGLGAEALQAAGRLTIRDHYVDTDEEGRLFRAADLVWLGYAPGFHGQSAVLAQAASAGVPVLGKSTGLIGRMVREARLGLTVDPGDAAAVRVRLAEAMSTSAAALAPGAARFAAQRNSQAYRQAWAACLFGRGESA